MKRTTKVFVTGLEALAKKRQGGGWKGGGPGGSIATVTKAILRYPIKTIAAFLVAPLLAFRVVRVAKNPIRRFVAGIGLFIAMLLAWLAGTFLGTLAGAALIASGVGLIWGIAFFVGTTLSVTLSVVFSILVLNATSWLFLHLSSEDVLIYLKSISE